MTNLDPGPPMAPDPDLGPPPAALPGPSDAPGSTDAQGPSGAPAGEAGTPPSGQEPVSRAFALVQVIAVCGLPTQLAIALLLLLAGQRPLVQGELSLEFFATVAFVDTAAIASLILLFLTLSRESPRDVFVGRVATGRQIVLGLALVPVSFFGVAAVVLTLRWAFPWLHTVEESPMDALMRTPFDAAIFLVVAVVAGGVREELQRAFIIHRFGQRLGGPLVGLAAFSLLFGILHFDQGWDVAIAIGLLGLAWGIVYVRTRSLVFPMANHAGFNGAQVIQVLIARSLGVG